MSDTKTNKTEEQQSSQNSGLQFERRDIIKGLAAVPWLWLARSTGCESGWIWQSGMGSESECRG